MHAFVRHRHHAPSRSSTKETRGLILNGGWRYDLEGWLHDTFACRGQWRKLRQRTIALAQMKPGEQVLDVGCGTGTLAIEVVPLVVVRAGSSRNERAELRAFTLGGL